MRCWLRSGWGGRANGGCLPRLLSAT